MTYDILAASPSASKIIRTQTYTLAMARTIGVFSAAAVLLLALAYQFHLKPILSALGLGRSIEEIGNTACVTVPELQACESEWRQERLH
jgi:hypothetical protein